MVNLVRCAWAGSQRYGALVWSGDIHSSFEDFRKQIVAGLHMGMAGIPWWTTDIGGFAGGNPDDPNSVNCNQMVPMGGFLPCYEIAWRSQGRQGSIPKRRQQSIKYRRKQRGMELWG